MTENAAFIESLLRLVPALMPIYDEHLADNDTLLPHVFMGDVTRFAILKAHDLGSRNVMAELLDHLEEGLESGAEEVKELIIVSFIENLRGEGPTVEMIRPLMGTNMRKAVEEICEH
jgi:hypothetical protein